MRNPLIIVLSLLLMMLSSNSQSAELAGIEMDDHLQLADQSLILNGMGLRKKFFFKVYVAGLYLSAKQSSAQKILNDDATRQMTMVFKRRVDKEALCNGWIDGLKVNVPNASDTVKKQFSDELCSWMSDVEESDQLLFIYQKGKGTEVRVKGELAGNIEGKLFADALFSCWIGDKPPSDDFKDGLLGIY